jgi:Mrp family chromosome partitioning ATPase
MEIDDGFRTLRLTVDAAAPRPAVVLVGSVTSRDGVSRVAHGLALALVESGARTLLVTPGQLPRRIDGFDTMTLGEMSGGKSAFAELREHYDATVILAPALAQTARALELTRHVDGVILAVRLGRPITAEDERIGGDLQRIGASIIGVVTTNGKPGELVEGETVGVREPRRAGRGGAAASVRKETVRKEMNAWRIS